jgi:hypothetical protein
MTMVYLFPFRDVRAPISLPVASTVDRLVLPALALAWIVAFVRGGRGAPRLRVGPFDIVLWVFLAVVAISVLANFPDIVERGEWGLAIRRFSVLIGYVTLFYLAVTIIRPSEIRAFGRLIVVLGCVLAAALMYEYSTGVNLFVDAARVFFPASKGAGDGLADELGRFSIAGPSGHGLVAASLLAVGLAFAAADMVRARRVLMRVLYVLAFGLLLAGGFATFRKSSAVLPAAAMLAFIVSYPRALPRVLPVAAVAIGLVILVFPGALESVVNQLDPTTLEQAGTTRDRLSDYSLVLPDLVNDIAIGRGYGTYDANRYTLLDNQYLKTAVETGALGVLAYVVMILSAIALAVTARLRASADGAPVAAALIAGLVAVAISNALYDALGFVQLGYIFFFLSACAVVASKDSTRVQRAVGVVPRGEHRPARAAIPGRLGSLGSRETVFAGGVVIVVVAAAMILGGLASDGPASRVVTSGPIALERPADWQELQLVPRVPGLALDDAIAVGQSREGAEGVLLAGVTQTRSVSLLPQSFRARLRRTPSRDDAVTLGTLAAYRYRNLQRRSSLPRLTMFVAPTTAGIVTLVCLGEGDFIPQCEKAAASVSLVRGQALPLDRSRRLVTVLDPVFDELNASRRSAVRDVRRTATQDGQQIALARLAAGDVRAATALDTAPVEGVARPPLRSIARALRAAEAAHLGLAVAVRDRSPRRFRDARRTVAASERRVLSNLALLRNLGYEPKPLARIDAALTAAATSLATGRAGQRPSELRRCSSLNIPAMPPDRIRCQTPTATLVIVPQSEPVPLDGTEVRVLSSRVTGTTVTVRLRVRNETTAQQQLNAGGQKLYLNLDGTRVDAASGRAVRVAIGEVRTADLDYVLSRKQITALRARDGRLELGVRPWHEGPARLIGVIRLRIGD